MFLSIESIRSYLSVVTIFSTCLTAFAKERPNILWVVSEDNSVHYSRLYDENGASMPNVERLAASGLIFNHAFSNAPVCSSARSTIISSCYGPRLFSQHHRKSKLVPMPDGLEMFPAYLRQAGYYTSNHTKEDYNIIKSDAVWDDSSKDASYRNRSQGQPFFHVENFGSTHEGQLHFNKAHMTERRTQTAPETVNIFPIHPDTPTFRYTNAFYRDLHRKVDREIGDFLSQLEADGVMDDTIIFYYGDHGGVLPGSKGYAYERGLHVPLVVYAPDKWKHLLPAERGSRVDGFVEFVDLGPTVLNLAGLKAPPGVDGKAFLGEGVQLEELDRRNTAFGYADRFDEKYDMVRTMRVGNMKYMRSYQPFNVDGLHNSYRYKSLAYQEWRELHRADKLNDEQRQFFEPRPAEALFDLANDPFELHNLAGDPSYAKDLVHLRAALQKQIKSLPDLGFFPESYALETFISNPTAFGQQNRARIERLIDTADLSLKPYPLARQGIADALQAKDSWLRYWGLIVCSSFGMQALEFVDQAKVMATNDNENLVRVRASEFLGLTQQLDPMPILKSCIQRSTTPEEANLILNTVTLLRDSDQGYTFEISESLFPADWLKGRNSEVKRRLNYLSR
ncbi:sulfatase [Pelagicoccus enzymogenes]|uniref:sulfatase family protein n=1 Tax=Pelagicoccus enzymogenes TaxID=2773457 RepID=UPI00280EB601|nr:sulfatase [Pelagicoccus enzymogenes]MDQ8199448.1 sulfatase [Pelagicoccus enzymogenes]